MAVDLHQGGSIGVNTDSPNLEQRSGMDQTIERKIVELLDRHHLMTVATRRSAM
jgi:hypothetical protein